MSNSNSNIKRNAIRGVIAAVIIIIILLCLRLCKQDEEKIQPSHVSSTTISIPSDQDTVLTQQGKKQKVYVPRKKVKAPIKAEPNEIVAYAEETDSATEQVHRPTVVNDKPDPGKDTNSYIREPKSKYIFSHKQYYQTRIGIRAGVGYSVIGNLGAIIEDGSIRPRYTMEENGALVLSIGFFALWRHDRLGVELAADYTWLSSTLKEHKQMGNINEKTVFRYHLIMPQVSARLYLLSDIYMGVGVGMSIPLTPGGIDFSSNRVAMFASVDELTQAHLRETLRARLHVIPLLKVGYSSFKNGIEASLQYGYGMTDLIKTHENPYGYHKATNNSHQLLITVGYTIPLTKQK